MSLLRFRSRKKQNVEARVGPLGLSLEEEYQVVQAAITEGRVKFDTSALSENTVCPVCEERERKDKLDRAEHSVMETGDSMILHPEFKRGELVKFVADQEDCDPHQVIAYIVDGSTSSISYRVSHPSLGWRDVTALEIEPYVRGVNI